MTRTPRRDKGLFNASAIAGMRMEKALAQRVADAARERADGDVAQLVRYLIRTGLGYTHDDANQREAAGGFTLMLRGLKVEASLAAPLDRYAAQAGLGRAGAVRRLLRVGLGMKGEESKRREAVFAEIASAKHGMMEEIG